MDHSEKLKREVETRLVAISGEQVERLRWIANYIVSEAVVSAWGDEWEADANEVRSLVAAYEEGITEEDARLLDTHLRLTREQIGRDPESWVPWRKLRSAFEARS